MPEAAVSRRRSLPANRFITWHARWPPPGPEAPPPVHAGAPEEVHGGGVDLVDERVDGEAPRQVFALLEERAGLPRRLQCEPACVLWIAGRFKVGGQGL